MISLRYRESGEILTCFRIWRGIGNGIRIRNGLCERLGGSLGLPASLPGTRAPVVGGDGLGLGCGLRDSESLCGCVSSALELPAPLAGARTPVVDGFCVGHGDWGCCGLDGGSGQDGGVDDGGDLHVD